MFWIIFNIGFTDIKVICLCKPKSDKHFNSLTKHLEIFKNNLVECYGRLIYLEIVQQLKEKKCDLYYETDKFHFRFKCIINMNWIFCYE